MGQTVGLLNMTTSNGTTLATAVENQKSDKEDKESARQPGKTMGDLPPEVLTIILENLSWNESRNNMLAYRLVNSQFKEIIDSVIKKKISSCQLPVFPGMKVLCAGGGHDHDLFHVRHSPSMYSADRNLFPFSSLLLSGNGDEIIPNYFTDSFPDIRRRMIGLPEFVSIFGGYLTSVALHDVTVPGGNSLVKLLTSMPNLRRLSFKDVALNDRIMEPNVVLPVTLPPLPNLSTFESKGGRIPHLWLIASYADQLVRLNLETEEPLPALQKGRQYSDSLAEGNTLYIATTSDTAFDKLTELKINRVNKNFLRLTEFPKLKRLSVTGLADDYNRDFQDVTFFISKCRNTLEKLRLDVTWEVLMGQEANDNFKRTGYLPVSTIFGIQSSFPTLKTLEIHYPARTCDGTMISRFLALFPALETLHFLHFPAKFITTNEELQIVNKALKSGNQLKHADQIAAQKTRLTSLYQEWSLKSQSFFKKRNQLRRSGRNGEYELVQNLCRLHIAFIKERDAIFDELATLGERKQDVVVQQFLQAHRIWNNFPNLKVVSVSSGGKPEGDVYKMMIIK